MPLLKSPKSPVYELPFLSVTGLAAPSRGAQETCVWRISIAPGAPGVPHWMDREEIFVALEGRVSASVGADTFDVEAGDTLIVPAGETFALANAGTEPFVAVAVLPVGGRAVMPAGETITPPWTQ